MIKLNYACMAQGLSVDSATGHVSLFHIVEDLFVPTKQLPLSIPEAVLVASFTRFENSVPELKFKLEYLQPQKEAHVIAEGALPFEPSMPSTRLVMRLNGMPIETVGAHTLRLRWSWGTGEDDDAGFDILFRVVAAAERTPS